MHSVLLPSLLIMLLARPGLARAEETVVSVFDSVRIELDPDLGDPTPRDGHLVRSLGRTIETSVELPPAPQNQRDARRIEAVVTVQPVLVKKNGGARPADEWTRLGSVSLLLPAEAPMRTTEVELMRFTTGFGGQGTFRQDVTTLAPLLAGRRTLRLSVSTFRKPAWEVSLLLIYNGQGAGYRRPRLVQPLFNDPLVTAEEPRLRASVRIPPGLAMPRLRIITTGHASDGTGGDEFIARTHVLRIDGREVARWRPWSESGGSLRDLNPTSGRTRIDGRWLWSSDFDRSGWHPGTAVEPLLIPAPELTAGRHAIELEILDIRPKEAGAKGFGYWRVSAVIVADEPWPRGAGGDDNPPDGR
ncbi:MAG: peptide-N-glycosidase F-related protein [Planctomycetota bacterium]|jgi:hypothetical protein